MTTKNKKRRRRKGDDYFFQKKKKRRPQKEGGSAPERIAWRCDWTKSGEFDYDDATELNVGRSIGSRSIDIFLYRDGRTQMNGTEQQQPEAI